MARNLCWLFLTLLLSVTWCTVSAQGEYGFEQTKTKRKIDFASVPIISYNTTYGAVIGLSSMLFYDAVRRDTISHASVAGVGGGVSENRSVFVGSFAQSYLKQNKWRSSPAGGV